MHTREQVKKKPGLDEGVSFPGGVTGRAC